MSASVAFSKNGNCRRVVFPAILLATLLSTAEAAFAQNPATCSNGLATSVPLRHEGKTELIGDIIFVCARGVRSGKCKHHRNADLVSGGSAGYFEPHFQRECADQRGVRKHRVHQRWQFQRDRCL